ncbi:DNA-binding transcriptional LysR family regulator [Bradyrhizobium sp. USDA 4369]
MKLQQLRYFCAVVQTGSITVAASKLGVSQPALSAALKALEEELGGALLEGKRGEMRPTLPGESFHAKAARILKECEAAKVEFRRGQSRRRIKIGVLSTIKMQCVTAFQQSLATLQPDIDVALREGSTDTLLAALSGGRIDAAIMALNMASSGGWVPLVEEPVVLACRPDDSLAACSSVKVQQLDSKPFILRSHCERSRDGHDILTARGVRLNVVLKTNQDQRAMEAVKSMNGITIAPLSLITELSAVPLDDFGLTRSLGMYLSKSLEQGFQADLVSALKVALEENMRDWMSK